MLRELIEICEQNGITYYAAGGTTLGAVRHAGFIPWDDDVDVMMPRRDWELFVQVAKDGGLPQGRRLCCLELDDEYPHVFGRYVDLTTTSIHYNQFLGGTPEGLVIDIFVLDAIPNDTEAFARHRETLALYTDLANPYGYSYPMSSSKKVLRQYTRRIEAEGRAAVLAELAGQLSAYEEESCDFLVMRWAAAPRLFEKSLFAYDRFEMFEGVNVRVPGRCADYLVKHYGDDWMYVPAAPGRITHDAITFVDVPYDKVMNDYVPFVDVDRAKKAILRRRNAHIRDMDEIHRGEDAKAHIIASFTRRSTLQRAQGFCGDFNACMEESRNDELDAVFGAFYKWQLDACLEGREEYLAIRRYYDPVYIDIGDDLLEPALLNLLDTNRVSQAARILRIREMAKGEVRGDLAHVRALVEALRLPASLQDVGCPDAQCDLGRSILARRPGNFTARLILCEHLRAKRDYQALELEAQEGLRRFPQSGEFAKYLADAKAVNASSADEVQEVCELYADAMARTTHEGIRQAVVERLIDDNLGFSDDQREAITRRAEGARREVPKAFALYDIDLLEEKTEALLEEVVKICADNGIGYVLGPHSCMLAWSTGDNLCGSPSLDVLVAAGDMARLAQAMLEQQRPDRQVDCWLTNGRHLSYQIDYVDKTSTYLQLRQGTNIIGHGLKVTIVPFRANLEPSQRRKLEALEIGWEINGYELTKKISARRATQAASARMRMLGGRARLASGLFNLFGEAYGVPARQFVVRYPEKQGIVLDAEMLLNTSTVRFAGKGYSAPSDMEGFLSLFYGDDWKGRNPVQLPQDALIEPGLPYEQAFRQCVEDGCDPKDYFALMRRIRIGMLPYANDLRIRNKAMALAQRSSDRKMLYDAISRDLDTVRKLVRANDCEALGELLRDYDEKAHYYLNKGLGLCPSKELLDALCMVWRSRGLEAEASKLEELAPEEHYYPIEA